MGKFVIILSACSYIIGLVLGNPLPTTGNFKLMLPSLGLLLQLGEMIWKGVGGDIFISHT